MEENNEFNELVKERFGQLPKVVQDAILSTDIQKRLRELADTHKLHLDQWDSLENEVQYTLLGIQPSEDLAKNIQKEVGVQEDVAEALANDISKIVFEPIREELERQLEHPDAQAAAQTDVEAMRTTMLKEQTSTPSTVAPATPPVPPPTVKVERAPISESYAAQTASHERKTIDGDPYREQLS